MLGRMRDRAVRMEGKSKIGGPRLLYNLALLGAIAALPGCAFMNSEKRPLLGAMDRGVAPEDPWAMITLTPVMIPVGLLAGIADAFFIFPATQIPPCAGRINEAYFKRPDEGALKKSLLFIPRHFVAVPDFFALWAVRSFIDLHPSRRGQFRRGPPGNPFNIDTKTNVEGLEINVTPSDGPPKPEDSKP